MSAHLPRSARSLLIRLRLPHCLRLGLLGALLSASLAASACKPAGLEFELSFAPGDTRLSAQQALALANWFIRMRDELQATEVGVYGKVQSGQAVAQQTQARLQNIERLLQTMNTQSMPVYGHIFREPEAPLMPDLIALNAQPGCLKTKSCCPGQDSRPAR